MLTVNSKTKNDMHWTVPNAVHWTVPDAVSMNVNYAVLAAAVDMYGPVVMEVEHLNLDKFLIELQRAGSVQDDEI